MLGSLRDYALALLMLLAGLGVYQWTVTRWVTPPVVEQAPIAARTLVADDESLADLFAPTAWQRGRSTRLKTSDGMLLFQECQQVDRTTWRLRPITIVIGRGLSTDRASNQPILIEASEGAVIEFDSALDVMSGVAPSIHRGQMLGAVRIQRIQSRGVGEEVTQSAYHVAEGATPPSGRRPATGSQTLDIRTGNVGIDRRRIWTTEAIHMQVGRASLVGRDLTLYLTASAADGSSGRGGVTGALDRMELVYLRELTLPLGEPEAAGEQSQKEATKGVVEVRCGGSIEYDFAMDRLRLQRDVELLRLPGHGGVVNDGRSPPPVASGGERDADWIDRFQCDALTLTMRDPMNSDRSRDGALDWIDRIEATGSPLRLTMQEQSLDLVAGHVLFDPIEGYLVAEPMSSDLFTGGWSPPPESAPAGLAGDRLLRGKVVVRRGDLQASLSQIVYQFDPDSPEQLGILEVDRGGEIIDLAVGSVLQTLQWGGLLRVQPMEDLPDHFVIECDGGLKATLADGGHVVAQEVTGRLKPEDDDGAFGGPDAGSLNRRLVPEEFAILGGVRIRTASLDAQTERMNLFFEHTDEVARVGQGGSSNSGGAAEGGSIRQWVRQPGADDSDATSGQKMPPATIRGQHVVAKLTMGGGELTATDLSVRGDVEVTHPLRIGTHQSVAAGSNRAPGVPAKLSAASSATGSPLGAAVSEQGRDEQVLIAKMTGDQLRLLDGSEDILQLSSVTDRPSRFRLGDGYFIGSQIQVRPSTNYVWIPGAGEFVLPTALLPPLQSLPTGSAPTTARTRSATAAGASQRRWERAPRCRFGESMTFDGRVATLGGGVQLDAAIADNRGRSEIVIRGDQLELSLNEGVQLSAPESFRRTEVKEISLLQTSDQPVEIFVDQFAGDGVRESRHHLSTPRLSWRPGSVPAGAPSNPMTTGGQGSAALAGELLAPGPGSYRAWLRSTGGGFLRSDSGDAVAAGTQTDSSRDSGAWRREGQGGSVYSGGLIEDSPPPVGGGFSPDRTMTGVHLIYQGTMRGDLVARSLTFSQGVRLAKGAVSDFESVAVNASEMDMLATDQMTLDCEQLRIGIDPATNNGSLASRSRGSMAAWELEAAGGVVFRTRTPKSLHEATADRCGYTSSKDLFVVQGAASRPAHYRQLNPYGQSMMSLDLRHATFRLRSMELVSSQIEGFRVSAPSELRPQ